MNKVILIGLVGADAEIRTFQNESKVMNFNLATSKRWLSKDGAWQNKTAWHKICVFNENVIKYKANKIKKGCKVFLEGEIVYEDYTDKDGIKRQITKINVNNNHELQVLNDKQTTNIESNDAEDIDDNMPF